MLRETALAVGALFLATPLSLAGQQAGEVKVKMIAIDSGFEAPFIGTARLRLPPLPAEGWRLEIIAEGATTVVTPANIETYRVYDQTIEVPVPRAGPVMLRREGIIGPIVWESMISDDGVQDLYSQGGKLELFDAAFRADPANAAIIARAGAVVLVQWSHAASESLSCSGVRIAATRVLTNRHCLPAGFDPKAPYGEVRVHFGEFRGNLADVVETIRARVVHVASGAPVSGIYPRDLAVLELARAPSAATYAQAILPLAAGPSIGHPVQLITVWQYSKPNQKAISRDPQKCKLASVDQSFGCRPGNQLHRCEAESGSSGSPILDAASQHVVALHFQGIGVSAGNCALGAGTIQQELAQIKP